jgi:sulfatase maturation enzyme AslB (radical SAM superfamily)
MSRRPPLVLVPQYFGSTVFDRRTSRYLPFDHETTDILRRSIATPIGDLVDGAAPARQEALGAFASAFYERGFFTHDLFFDGVALDIAPPADHLTGPLAVHLEIVAACNLTCSHCFAGQLPRREPPLSLPELDALFAALARVGSFRLGLTGGEPLLRKDLFEILDLATSHGLHPCLTTNALLLTEETARKLGERPLVWLNVSLDGATAATNDAVRGPGTFEQVMEKSERFRSIRGLPGDGSGTATFGGGCRARSLVMAGDVNAADPWLAKHDAAPARRNPLTVLRAERRLA